MTAKFLVLGLSITLTGQQIREQLAASGRVISVRLLNGAAGKSLGIGLIEMGSAEEAESARHSLPSSELVKNDILMMFDEWTEIFQAFAGDPDLREV
ncbi:MAG TPA: RNA-binding protein [Nitrospiraceae bacterium]|nr:RNA-binding protein [Nitrospiraceae bacterium]